MFYVASTFSPAMVEKFTPFFGEEVSLSEARGILDSRPEFVSAVSHEVTAPIVSALLQVEIPFNRVNLSLQWGDEVLCVIPKFRDTIAREFTFEEVSSAGYRIFWVRVG